MSCITFWQLDGTAWLLLATLGQNQIKINSTFVDTSVQLRELKNDRVISFFSVTEVLFVVYIKYDARRER